MPFATDATVCSCGRTFTNPKALLQHQRDAVGHGSSSNDGTSVLCSCGVTFVNTAAMFQHQRHSPNHTSPETPGASVACRCGTVFTSTKALSQHLRESPGHRSSPDGSAVLCTCGKAFKHAAALLQHQRDLPDHKAAVTEASVRCGCGMVFKHKAAMLQHQRHSPDHRSSQDDDPVLCGCGKVFDNAMALSQHQREQPSHVSVSDGTAVICTCGRTFKNAAAMLQHRRDLPDHRSARDKALSSEGSTAHSEPKQEADQNRASQNQIPGGARNARAYQSTIAVSAAMSGNRSQARVGTVYAAEYQPARPPQARVGSIYAAEYQPARPPQARVGSVYAVENQPARPPQARIGGILAAEYQPARPPQARVGSIIAAEHQPARPPQVNTVTEKDISSDPPRRPENHEQDSFQQGCNRWSRIPREQWPAMLELLSQHCHSHEVLLKNRYRVRPYGARDIEGLQRCKNCRSEFKRIVKSMRHLSKRAAELKKDIDQKRGTACVYHVEKKQVLDEVSGRQVHSCCRTASRGCSSSLVHAYTDPERRLAAKYREYASTPSAGRTPKRHAVSVDCEMAGIQGGGNAVVLICVVDYLTGETLLNTLVRPLEKVIDWRTRVSGVTSRAMAAATARGEALNGWRKARAELWKHIDADTILIGHALHHDLDVLRTVHTRVVDSSILAKQAVGPPSVRQWGLGTLCGTLLEIDIQQRGRKGHDPEEDALAARELVLWCMREPEKLEAWAQKTRDEEAKAKAAIEEARRARAQEKRQSKRPNRARLPSQDAYASSGDSWDDDLASPWFTFPDDDLGWPDSRAPWTDIAEDLGWSHPGVGHDSWST